MSTIITVERAREVIATRISQLDQAIAILGSSSAMGLLVKDARFVWEQASLMVSQPDADRSTLAGIGRACVESAQQARAQGEGITGSVLACVEVPAMLLDDYVTIRDRINAKIVRDRGESL